MQSNSESASRMEANLYTFSPSAACSEPWWRGTSCNTISPAVVAGNASNSSSMEQSRDGHSQSDGGLDEEVDDGLKESQISASPHSDGNYGQDHLNFQHRTSSIPPRSNQSHTQSPQLELVGHSIACASNPCLDPYYGGLMAAYGPQNLMPPYLLDMHNPRMPLPLEMALEPVYVNAKQYPGILRRRQSRAKQELEKKLIKVRKPYLHESRHQHAIRRARGSGGRFAKKSEAEVSKHSGEKTGDSGSAISLSCYGRASGAESLDSEIIQTEKSCQEGQGDQSLGQQW
ncbi:hypothetical protein NMG60_11033715 [Bertholletia excelsa]